ncbi:hypothetical protein NDU88_002994 [Pleurodeles waltl]|uniref:Uncharacterized protein n=1 Tax=Pleurodeles waltl TaxID=8319 RepID=A0AAV7UC46_PLEWA|nr:hypothetical protein NDU88_002994 [Pleurodeles waltl]
MCWSLGRALGKCREAEQRSRLQQDRGRRDPHKVPVNEGGCSSSSPTPPPTEQLQWRIVVSGDRGSPGYTRMRPQTLLHAPVVAPTLAGGLHNLASPTAAEEQTAVEPLFSVPKFQGFRPSPTHRRVIQGPPALHTTPPLLQLRTKGSAPSGHPNRLRGGPRRGGPAVRPQPRAAAAMDSLLNRDRHFRSRQPRSSQGDPGQSTHQRRSAAVLTGAG